MLFLRLLRSEVVLFAWLCCCACEFALLWCLFALRCCGGCFALLCCFCDRSVVVVL